MPVNVKIKRKNNESSVSALKRFSRKVKESGVLQFSRTKRYSGRNLSEYTKKKKRLNSIKRKAEIEKKIKLGKLAPKQGRNR